MCRAVYSDILQMFFCYRVASSSAHTVAAGAALADTLDSSASWTLDLGPMLIGPLPPEATLL